MPANIEAEDHLLNVNEDGSVPKPPEQSRLNSCMAADELFYEAWQADRESAYDRAQIQAMIDGEAPYDKQELKDLGQAERCNINWLEGKAKTDAALMAYNDLTSSVDKLVSVETTYGEETERAPWEEVIAEEFSKMLRRWGRFEFNIQMLARHFIDFGLGVSYFEDDLDWRWKVCGFGDFLLPRNTPANQEDIDYAMIRRRYTVTDLYKFIRDEEAAKAVGWNVKETRAAIRRASTQKDKPPSALEWEELEREIKNNDIYFGRCRAKEVYVVHFWVKEFDGTVSHFITCEDQQEEDFLYRKVGRFDDIEQAFQVFTYGIGNDFYHSIRGLGYLILPQVQVGNQLQCSMVDGAQFASAQPVQPADEESADKLAFAYAGPFVMLSPGVKFAEMPRQNNIAQGVLPIVEDLRAQIRENTGSYQSYGAGDVQDGGERKTKLQVQGELSTKAALSTAAMNLFYIPWEKLLREVFRRVVSKDLRATDPGGKQAFEFRKRCAKRGVPMNALYEVNEVHAVRSIGFGSPQARVLALDEVASMMPQMDEVGRNNALQDRIASRVGYTQARRYVTPLQEGVRKPIDQHFAELENAAIEGGASVSALPQDSHKIHLDAHLGELSKIMTNVRSGQADPVKALQMCQGLFQHCQEHLEFFQKDTSRVPEARAYNKAMNVLGGLIIQLQNNVQEMMEKAQAAQQEQQQLAANLAGGGGPPKPGAAAPSGAGGGGPLAVGNHPPGPEAQAFQAANDEVPLDPLQRQRMQQQFEEHSLRLHMMLEQARVKNQVRAEEAAQKLSLDNARLASAGLREARAQTPSYVSEDLQGNDQF